MVAVLLDYYYRDSEESGNSKPATEVLVVLVLPPRLSLAFSFLLQFWIFLSLSPLSHPFFVAVRALNWPKRVISFGILA